MFLSLLMFSIWMSPQSADPGTMATTLKGHIRSVTDTIRLPGAAEVVERKIYDADGFLIEYTVSTGYEHLPPKLYRYKSDMHGHRIEQRLYDRTSRTPLEYITYEYDTKGNLLAEQKFDAKDRRISTHTLRYDLAGRLIEDSREEGAKLIHEFYEYNTAGYLIRDSIADSTTPECSYFKYDAKGKQIQSLHYLYTKDAIVWQKEISKRDAKGNQTELTHTESDSTMNFRDVMVYRDTALTEIRRYRPAGLDFVRTTDRDKRGNIIEETYHTYLGNKPETKKIHYTVNQHGDATEEISYLPDGNIGYKLVFEYEYDAFGNMIRKVRIKGDDRSVILARAIQFW